MFRRCLYCGHTLSPHGDPTSTRDAVRVAFDPARARLWSVCDRCHGWNLWWRDERWEALVELERLVQDEARVLYETDHISLLQAGARQLVRVGPAPRREEAWWRYGTRLRHRHHRFRSTLRRIGAASYSAVSSLGVAMGLGGITGDFRGTTNRYADVLRWRLFGNTAWAGRAPCPNCSSVLIRLFFFRSPDLILMPAEGGAAAIGMPCTRCDPWTVEKTFQFDTSSSEPVLRRVLAWGNIDGATRSELNRSISLIESEGSAGEFVRRLAEERLPLRALARTHRLALEIAINERAERERLAREAAALDTCWQRAEALAEIMDEELSGP
jgi:hypothetical protein